MSLTPTPRSASHSTVGPASSVSLRATPVSTDQRLKARYSCRSASGLSSMPRSRWNRVPAAMIRPAENREAPPAASEASATRTEAPASAAVTAAHRPAAPAPTTTTS